MTISLIICTKDQANQLDICLNYIEQLDTCDQDFESILVNNNSTYNTEEVIENYANRSKHKVKNYLKKIPDSAKLEMLG